MALRALLLAGLLLAPTGRPAAAAGSDVCPERNDGFENACRLGQPNANGATVAGFLSMPGDVDAYQFLVGPNPMSAHLNLSDLWYDTDLSLYETLTGRVIAQAHFMSESRRSGQAQSQMSAPELIVEQLLPGSYTAFVYAADLQSFDLNRGYTLRVALTPPVVPQPGVPDGQGLSWKKDGYQLSLTTEPIAPTRFSLLTFTAIVDPSFTDLFDFAWEIDGKVVAGAVEPTLQVPAAALANTPGGRHTVRVIATGARPYPDPARPHIPPTLSAVGTIEIH